MGGGARLYEREEKELEGDVRECCIRTIRLYNTNTHLWLFLANSSKPGRAIAAIGKSISYQIDKRCVVKGALLLLFLLFLLFLIPLFLLFDCPHGMKMKVE